MLKINRKKCICIFFLVIIYLLIYFYNSFIKYSKYNINVSPKTYGFEHRFDEKNYLEFIKKNIKPKKLLNFIDLENLYIDDVFQNDGITFLNYIKKYGYQNLFNYLFNKNTTTFSNCPCTVDFQKKFTKNLSYEFDLIKTEDTTITCEIDYSFNKLTVYVESNYVVGEPENIDTYTFIYYLDDEGNIDDIEVYSY